MQFLKQEIQNMYM